MTTFSLTIATSDDVRFHGAAVSVTVPGTEGEMTILAGHEALASVLRAGTIRVESAEGEAKSFEIPTGVVEVSSGSVTILL